MRELLYLSRPKLDTFMSNGRPVALRAAELGVDVSVVNARIEAGPRLEEHFRCVPEIINWSSSTFYDNKLLPLRQYGGERLDPLRTHFVEDAVAKG
ncbi:hypothetical protein ACWGH2_01750 [Streptomyces sp. NPDC054871]